MWQLKFIGNTNKREWLEIITLTGRNERNLSSEEHRVNYLISTTEWIAEQRHVSGWIFDIVFVLNGYSSRFFYIGAGVN